MTLLIRQAHDVVGCLCCGHTYSRECANETNLWLYKVRNIVDTRGHHTSCPVCMGAAVGSAELQPFTDRLMQREGVALPDTTLQILITDNNHVTEVMGIRAPRQVLDGFIGLCCERLAVDFRHIDNLLRQSRRAAMLIRGTMSYYPIDDNPVYTFLTDSLSVPSEVRQRAVITVANTVKNTRKKIRAVE